MKRILEFLVIIVFLFPWLNIDVCAQTNFVSGYFINNTGEKTECFIKDFDWQFNPSEIEVKLKEKDSIFYLDLSTISEFAVDSKYKFIRFTVNMDMSSNNVSKLSNQRNPHFEKKTVFLKLLVSGEYSLLYYQDIDKKRFFYKNKENEIIELICKDYIYDGKILSNNSYKQDLLNKFGALGLPEIEFSRLNYKVKDLSKLFSDINNKSNGSNLLEYNKDKRKSVFINVRPGLVFTNLSFENVGDKLYKVNFSTNFTYRLGVELALSLPFYNNKLTFLIEPTIQKSKDQKSYETNQVVGGSLTAKIDYTSIELPLGIRYNLKYTKNGNVFLNVAYVFDFNFGSTLKYVQQNGNELITLPINTFANPIIGLGYNFNKKYSMELRYGFNRDLFTNLPNWRSTNKTIGLLVGYNIY